MTEESNEMQNEEQKTTEQPAQQDQSSAEKVTRARYIKYAVFVFLGLIILSAWWGAYMTIMASQR